MGNEVSNTTQGTSGQSAPRRKSLSNLQSNLADLTMDDPDKIINILLLGETGVGKSTFINSMVNYLSFQNFDKAEKDNLIILIPTSFMAYDKDGNNVRLEVGDKHKNENLTVGSSVTQLIRTYTFSIKGGYRLRLIDTPGMGDTRGPEQDEQNCEYILGYISNLKSLHAICHLFRPQDSRATVHFRYCMTQILSRLEKSACDNLIFIFTDSKDFNPGETYSILKQLAEDIKKSPPHAKIPVDTNKFCFDNEPFKYLAAKQRGVQFGLDIRPIMAANWMKSTEQCWKLIDYISNLKPHNVRNTAAINECRRIIYQLSQPMAEIAQLIDDNLYMLQRHEATMKLDENSIEQLKRKLFIPVVDLEVKELPRPVTVCTNSKCAEMFKVGERTKWHYKQRCHNPCYLRNVTKDIIGDPALIGCWAMSNSDQTCSQCGCHYKQHMHVYYESTTVSKEKLDENVQKNVHSKEAVLDNARKVMAEIKKKRDELEAELDIIIECNAKFAYFLQNNAITPINDCYEDYIKHLIAVEKRLGSSTDQSKLASLNQMLKEHNQIKATLKKAEQDRKKLGNNLAIINPDDIQCCVEELYKLQHNGLTIEKMYNAQNQSREREYLDSEYIHTGEFDRQRQEEADANAASGENAEKQGGGGSGNSRQNQQRNNRGRSQQRGNRGYNNRSRGNQNFNYTNRQNYQTASNAPPSYNQSFRDFGRSGGPSNTRRGPFQTRYNGAGPAGHRTGYTRQNSGPDRPDAPFPKIEVNVTVPPKAAQSSSRDYHYQNFANDRGYQQRRNSDYGGGSQPGYGNPHPQQPPPPLSHAPQHTGFPPSHVQPTAYDYQTREDQPASYNRRNEPSFATNPREYGGYPSHRNYPSHYNEFNNNPAREYQSLDVDPRASPRQYSQDRDNYPRPSLDQSRCYPPPTQGPSPGQPQNADPRPTRDYPPTSYGVPGRYDTSTRGYHQPENQPQHAVPPPDHYERHVRDPRPVQHHLEGEKYPKDRTNYPRDQEPLGYAADQRGAAQGYPSHPGTVQGYPRSQAPPVHPNYDGYARAEVKQHPVAGAIIIEDYPRRGTPGNPPRYEGYQRRAEYPEQMVNHAADRPGDSPVGGPYPRNFEGKPTAQEGGYNARPNEAGDSVSHPNQPRYEGYQCRSEYPEQMVNRAADRPGDSPVGAPYPRNFEGKPTDHGGGYNARPNEAGDSVPHPNQPRYEGYQRRAEYPEQMVNRAVDRPGDSPVGVPYPRNFEGKPTAQEGGYNARPNEAGDSVSHPNQPRYEGYQRRSEYPEQMVNRAADRPGDSPVGVPYPRNFEGKPTAQEGGYNARPNEAGDSVSHPNQPRYEGYQRRSEYPEQMVNRAVDRPGDSPVGAAYPRNFEDKPTEQDGGYNARPRAEEEPVSNPNHSEEYRINDKYAPLRESNQNLGVSSQKPADNHHQSRASVDRPTRYSVDDNPAGITDMIRRTKISDNLTTDQTNRDFSRREDIERHPENPFQTFESELVTSRQLSKELSQNMTSLQTEDLMSFDPYSSECQGTVSKDPGRTAQYPEELFGNIENPVRVITQKTYGPGEYPSEFQSKMEHHTAAQKEFPPHPQQSYPRLEGPPQPYGYHTREAGHRGQEYPPQNSRDE